MDGGSPPIHSESAATPPALRRIATFTSLTHVCPRKPLMVASEHMPDLENPLAHDPVFALHAGGKMEVASRVALNGPDELSLAYTPGVARVCEAIAADEELVDDYT